MPYRGKRWLDLVVASFLLLALFPLLLLVALLVKFFSGSPVIYRRKVVGIGERPFFMLKFRSMVNNAEEQEEEIYKENSCRKPVNDTRVTGIGRLLRKTSVDELLLMTIGTI